MALPTELDFVKNPVASPQRMNQAMEYLIAKLRAVESVIPEYDSITDTLRSVGLERLNEALTPIFSDASELADALEAIRQEWVDTDFAGDLADAVAAAVTTAVTASFSDYRIRYLGARASAPTLDDEGNAVVVGAMYYDTILQQMRVLGGAGWKDAGSVVTGLMQRQSFTASGGETSVTVPGGYDPGNIIVSVNGLVLAPSDVVVTSGTAIDLPGALSAGDEVTWTKFSPVTVANTYSQTYIDALIAGYYTKSQVDTFFANVAGWLAGVSGKTANYTVASSDKSKTVRATGSNSWTLTLPNAATFGVGAFRWQNDGTGEITLARTGTNTIDGLTGYKSYAGESRDYFSDGTNWTSKVLNGFALQNTASLTFTHPPGYKAYAGNGVGAGAGGGNNSNSSSGGGGGFGEPFVLPASLFTPGTTITITIGAGGLGGQANNAGGDTLFGSILGFQGGRSIAGGGPFVGVSAVGGAWEEASTSQRGIWGTPSAPGSAVARSSKYGGGFGAGTTAGPTAGNSIWGGPGGGSSAALTAGVSTIWGTGATGVATGVGNSGAVPGAGGGGTGSSGATFGGDGFRGQLNINGVI